MPVKEAAQYLKLNYMTIYKLAQKRKVPASKIGGTWRFRKDILDR
jgi:excisionase family DNA binding protein